MEFLKDIGMMGFLFFLAKGVLWVVLFLLVYFGVISKQKIRELKGKIFFWRKKEGN